MLKLVLKLVLEVWRALDAHGAGRHTSISVRQAVILTLAVLRSQVAKERFAMMLADMREKGATDDDLKEIITPENYERFKKISQNMIESQAS